MGRKVQRGNPIFTLRMPEIIIDGLHQMAADQSTTASEILRDLAIEELRRFGYPTTEKPIEGQVRLE